MPCSPQLPEGDVLVEAQAVVALLLRHVAPLLPARNEPVWHHSVTTATPGPPVCFFPPWATLLEDRRAPRAPGCGAGCGMSPQHGSICRDLALEQSKRCSRKNLIQPWLCLQRPRLRAKNSIDPSSTELVLGATGGMGRKAGDGHPSRALLKPPSLGGWRGDTRHLSLTCSKAPTARIPTKALPRRTSPSARAGAPTPLPSAVP